LKGCKAAWPAIKGELGGIGSQKTPMLSGYVGVEGELEIPGRCRSFAAAKTDKYWICSPVIPIKPPEHSISQEILASTCGEYFLQRHIHVERLLNLPALEELVQLLGLHSAYEVAY